MARQQKALYSIVFAESVASVEEEVEEEDEEEAERNEEKKLKSNKYAHVYRF